MERHRGIHFYISIVNYNEIIKADEKKDGKVNHFIHALDTFFSSIEQFGKKYYSNSFNVEKITGSRLHLYVVDSSVIDAFQVVKDISVFALKLSQIINHEIGKYSSLSDFQINIGASYGKFYVFEFQANEEKEYDEITSIGYVANIAAKIQNKTHISSLGISRSIYSELRKEDKDLFSFNSDSSFAKYELSGFYSAPIKSLATSFDLTSEEFDFAREHANKSNICDVEPSEPRAKLSFDSLSIKNTKKIDGIPLFCDVRGFTSQFEKDDSNLEEMARKTLEILGSMYKVVVKNDGIHVQFQGDREFSVFHNISDKKCFKQSVLAGMRLIDAVKPEKVGVGIGASFGTMFATKIGARGEKDNIVLGQTVSEADKLEDQYAGENEIAITEDVYDGLKKEDIQLAKLFSRRGNVYVSSVGFEEYFSSLMSQRLTSNNEAKNYNPAWGCG